MHFPINPKYTSQLQNTSKSSCPREFNYTGLTVKKDHLVCNFNKSNILLYVRSYIHAYISTFSSSIHVHHFMGCIQIIFFIKCKKNPKPSYFSLFDSGFITFTYIILSAIFGIFPLTLFLYFLAMHLRYDIQTIHNINL